nr:hypothetical protein [Rhodoplanes serenus]
MARHLDRLLAEGVGDRAFVEPALPQNHRHAVPEPVQSEARADEFVLFELLPELAPGGPEAVDCPRSPVRVSAQGVGVMVRGISQGGAQGRGRRPVHRLPRLAPAGGDPAVLVESLGQPQGVARPEAGERHQGQGGPHVGWGVIQHGMPFRIHPRPVGVGQALRAPEVLHALGRVDGEIAALDAPAEHGAQHRSDIVAVTALAACRGLVADADHQGRVETAERRAVDRPQILEDAGVIGPRVLRQVGERRVCLVLGDELPERAGLCRKRQLAQLGDARAFGEELRRA